MITTPIQGNTLTKTYTIARITGPGKIRMEEVSLHPPGKGEVTVKIKGCGLCASSIPLWEGREWFQYPLAAGAPGHEAWGVVHQKGDGVSGLRQGDRVAVLSGNALAEFRNVTAEECVLMHLETSLFPERP